MGKGFLQFSSQCPPLPSPASGNADLLQLQCKSPASASMTMEAY
ncbi:hypothetical protein DsansV1_C01g0011721 [Dioscorea sansibarensis]